jgi:hypothetical protein
MIDDLACGFQLAAWDAISDKWSGPRCKSTSMQVSSGDRVWFAGMSITIRSKESYLQCAFRKDVWQTGTRRVVGETTQHNTVTALAGDSSFLNVKLSIHNILSSITPEEYKLFRR